MTMAADATYDDGDDVGKDEDGRGKSAGSTANLRPFRKGDPAASIAGRKGAETRRAKRAITRAETVAVAKHLQLLALSYERDQLGDSAAALAMEMIGRVSRGEIPVRNGSEAAELVRVLVDVARIEAGQYTSATVTVKADDIARAVALRDAARNAIDVVDVLDVDEDGAQT